MCGIVAAVSGHASVAGPRMASALRSLAHRGPDATGLWWSPDRRVAIGHTRLATRDVLGGAQPIPNEDGQVVAAVNGELYAIEGLRDELIARGHRFRARIDSELVVHAWEEWGADLVHRLRGEFALVVWDARDRVLFAARDRFGIKPLLWAQHDGDLFVASQACALFQLGLPVRWNEASLFQSASFQYAPPHATLFAGAHLVPGGHTLLWRDGRVSVQPYWDLAARAEPTAEVDEVQAARLVGSLLDDAVRVRLEADTPCAFQLSGGLDSASVLASAAALGGPVEAFTVAFDSEGGYDEYPKAEGIAKHVGAVLHRVPVSDRDIAESFPEAVVHAEGPCINAHASAKLLLSRAISRAGFKVVLTGEGADEILFGYAHLRADLDGGTGRVAASNSASSGLMLPNGDGIPTTGIAAALGYVPTWLAAKAVFGRRMRELVRDEFLDRHRGRDAAAMVLDGFDLTRLGGLDRVERSAYLWTRLALEGYILRSLGDALEMSHGVEGRLPFLDPEFVEGVTALPTAVKIRDGVEKWALRNAMRLRLPAEVIQREKHPFLAPPMGQRVLQMARDVVDGAAFASQPLFDPTKVRRLLRRLPDFDAAGRKAYDPVIYFLLSVGILQDLFAPTG